MRHPSTTKRGADPHVPKKPEKSRDTDEHKLEQCWKRAWPAPIQSALRNRRLPTTNNADRLGRPSRRLKRTDVAAAAFAATQAFHESRDGRARHNSAPRQFPPC
jgi:hypothetical protein